MPQQDQPLYESFYELQARPFVAAPRIDRFFPAGSIDQARQTLQRVIQRGEGIGLAIGASGTGKTLLCQMLADSLKAQMGVALLGSGRLASRRALLQAILFELGLRYRGMDEAELRLSLIDYLSSSKRTFPTLAVLLDEAHTLPAKLLEELRLIGNLVQDGESRIRIVLAGSPALEERLASPKLDSFNQRIAGRCYLSNLDREETVAFIRHQIAAVGGDSTGVVSDDAMVAIYRASDGIPRLINQIGDHSLIVGHLAGVKPITSATVEEAWADLQQLPAPWDSQSDVRAREGNVVEFGGLDDDAEPVESIPFRPAPAQEFGIGDPVEQLDKIADQLAEVEDFQPAGSIGPEVELFFPDLRSPFDEQFAEEEVILDRYSTLEASVFNELPHVSSAEGRELSAMLERVKRPQSPAAQLASQTISDDLQSSPYPAAATVTTTLDLEGEFSGSAESSEPELTLEINEAEEDEDADLLVVEDDPPKPLPMLRPAPLVRRQEYRQLFTRLRRG